jgi:hypothetical protein
MPIRGHSPAGGLVGSDPLGTAPESWVRSFHDPALRQLVLNQA